MALPWLIIGLGVPVTPPPTAGFASMFALWVGGGGTDIVAPVTPPPTAGPPIPGSGGDWGHRWAPVDYEKRHQIAEQFREIYAEIYARAEPESAIAEAAAALVAEYAPTSAPDFPPPAVVDWGAIAEEGRTIVARFRAELLRLDALIAATSAAMLEADDEDAVIALLMS